MSNAQAACNKETFRATATLILLLAGLLVLCLFIVLDVMEIAHLASGPKTGDTSMLMLGVIALLGIIMVLSGIGYPILYLVTAVFFCMWVYQAHRNLELFGVEGLKFSPGWSVGWFFIPFANLIVPYHAMIELWKATDPDYIKPQRPDGWKAAPVSGVVHAWWACWLVSNTMHITHLRFSMAAGTTNEYLITAYLALGSDVLNVVLYGVTFVLIRSLHDRQFGAFQPLLKPSRRAA